MKPRIPTEKSCDDYYLGYKLLFGMVVMATAVMIVITAAAYLVTVALLDPAPFENQPHQAKRQ